MGMDLHEQRTVFVRDGRSFARKNGLAFIETSALDATGVDTAFQRILQEIYKTQTKKQLKSQGGGGGAVGGGGKEGAQPARGQTISLSSQNEVGVMENQQRKQGCCGGGQRGNKNTLRKLAEASSARHINQLVELFINS